jgi:7-cyano-7-deazaguanine synthase
METSSASAATPASRSDTDAVAILISGGLDSAILLGENVRRQCPVYPLYIRNGLFWETVELQYLRRFLEAVRGPTLQPLQILEQPVADLYGSHWSITGCDVPLADTPDEAVFLPGRNVLLLAKALLWCHLHSVPGVALAALETNPFPDATAAFFTAFQDAVNRAVGGIVQIERPYAGFAKRDVMRRGRGMPLELTFSCIRPVGEHHCGVCNKCAERRLAFAAAGLSDPTRYDR